MRQAQRGDVVKVHYTGRLTDGEVFDTSEGRGPLEFTIGEGRIIPGFESAVIGMAVGEKKTQEIPSDEAYGPHFDDMVHVVDREELPDDIQLELGLQLQMTRPGARPLVVSVVDITEDTVSLDANHPLAGQDLVFDIELVEIQGV